MRNTIPVVCTLGAMSICLLTAGATNAATMVYTDRAAWEAAVGESATTEDFNALTPQSLPTGSHSVGTLTVEYVNASGSIADGTGLLNVDGTTYLSVESDGNPVRVTRLLFPTQVSAWAMDISIQDAGDSMHVTFGADVVDQNLENTLGDLAGFVGFVSDHLFSQVELTDPHPSFSVAGIDNVSFNRNALFVDGFESGTLENWVVSPP